MMSYLGSTTRITVPLDSEKWPKVPEAIKNAIWEDVADTFELPREKKKWIIAQAGVLMQNFKCHLTKEFVRGRDEDDLKDPPYSYIDGSQWKSFVKSRLDSSFTLSRLDTGNGSTIEVSRAMVWKEMRADKTGHIENEAALEVANTIDTLSQQSTQDDLCEYGREDILFQALKKEEHGGRVRGVGQGVTITKYFGNMVSKKEAHNAIAKLTSRLNSFGNKFDNLEKENANLKARIQQLEPREVNDNDMVIEDMIGNDMASNDMGSEDMISNDKVSLPQGVTECKLLLLHPTRRVVATGLLHNTPGVSQVIHGTPMPPNHARVDIKYVVENEALLPVPLPGDEVDTVGKAVGYHVAWPTHLIVTGKGFHVETSKAHRKQVGKKDTMITKNVSKTKSDLERVDIESLPSELRVVSMYVTKMSATEQITVPLDRTVFNHCQVLFFGREEVIQLLAVASEYQLKVQENRVERSTYIVNALRDEASNGRVFLAPYNTGDHWVLCVIDPHANVVYYLDSLRNKELAIPDDLTSIVDTALLIYRNGAQKNYAKAVRKETKWIHIQCPCQTNDIDCGYYVLRFMKEIMLHKSTKIPETYFLDCRSATYDSSQINEVRVELAHQIMGFADVAFG